MKFIYVTIALASLLLAWECPECDTENQGDFCTNCDLPKVPEGMEYVEASTVVIDGDSIAVPAFFIDSQPVTCRDMLSWLTEEMNGVSNVPYYITGQSELVMYGDQISEEFTDVIFVRYTPWVIYTGSQGQISSVTVQSGCFDLPAASITCDAAELYLEDQGKRLPGVEELTAAMDRGIVNYYDTWEVMNSYSDFISMTLSGVLGVSPSGLAMFSENQASEERVMWEWTRDQWNREPGTLPDRNAPAALVVKPLDPPVEGSALRESGYYNIIFRGVVSLPWYSGGGNSN
ncbi:MAG: hypothetical protein GF388_08950 [Candidatus Aegiribacteria sp.]|nr:hypothetical protein [Candidatus Aegiribacteria sp.]MBD3295194.1 hypothetical protein [Candidatus Fermentibacteria bacterium]